MYLCNPVIKDSMKKYVIYSLKGSAIKKDVIRRYSDFFKILFFIRVRGGQAVPGGQPDIAKALEKLPPHNDGEILEKYRTAFPEYYEAYDLILGKGKLKEFQGFLKKTLTNIKVIIFFI